MEELIEKIIKKLDMNAKEKDIKIHKDLVPVEIKADLQEVEQVLMNILDNAIKYSKNNSQVLVSLSKSTDKATIKVKLSQESEHVLSG